MDQNLSILESALIADEPLCANAQHGLSGDRQRVLAMQDMLADLPQVELLTQHHFAPIACAKPDRIYLRHVFHPAGIAVVGFEHLDDHLFVLCIGHLTVTTDDGDRDIHGPTVLLTKAGSKRVAYAHTDCVVMTIHATDLSDPDAIMDSILKPEPGSPYRKEFGGDV